jgi:Xaa-Pro aminopeptidase
LSISGIAADPRLERQQAVRSALEAERVDALLVSHVPNIRYLTGFSGSAGLAIVNRAETVLLVDFRYEAQAADEASACARVVVEQRNLWDRLWTLLSEGDISAVGFESHVVTVRDAERFGEGGKRWPWRPTWSVVERFRVQKTPDEVAAVRRAAALAGEAFEEILAGVSPGLTEHDVAGRLEAALRTRGSEGHPFPTIVASGPRAALPHAGTSGRAIERGDFVLLDFGAQVDGYCADLTRTVVLGQADARQRAVYEAVEAAQREALERVRVGMTGQEADALARDEIERRGFGPAFGHSLGHGLGLEVHEAPRLARGVTEALVADAVVTIEPGIYVRGWGGVRLEDDIHLAAEGPVLLSDGQTGLREL